MKPQFTTTLFALLTSLLATPWSGASPAGLTQKRFLDAARDRPVWVDLWYPAGETAGEERVFNGLGFADVAVDAALAPTRTPYPVVVLSHGANGSAVDYSWLATHLARHGYLVAGVSHHGESWRYGADTVDPQGLLRTWLRPEDVSFALDRLFETDPSPRPPTATGSQRSDTLREAPPFSTSAEACRIRWPWEPTAPATPRSATGDASTRANSAS